jgi:hypothetical protein
MNFHLNEMFNCTASVNCCSHQINLAITYFSGHYNIEHSMELLHEEAIQN